MPRKRTIDVQMPPDVYWTASRGRRYFYHKKNRGTAHAGPRTALGSDERILWQVYREKIEADPEPVAQTFGGMVEAFMASPKWSKYAPATKKDFGFYLGKMAGIWGELGPREISPQGVLALRDSMAESPGSANHLVTVGKVLCKWAIPYGWLTVNPFADIEPIQTDDDGHWPWPDWAVSLVLDKAWPDLARFVFLAVETGQRESDLVRMGQGWMEGRGIRSRPQKTRRRRGAFWIPLTAGALARIARWSSEPLVFTGGRWGHESQVQTPDTFFLSPAGNAYTTEGIRSRWNRWLRTADGTDFLKRWAAWESDIRERDQMPATGEMRPTLHGLRATAVVRRRLAGYQNEQISNDIGMSIQMVIRYARFIDQAQAAATNIVLLDRSKANSL
ncbi:MAG: hypothetical protein AB7J19_01910 [Beijerinckiaceae bacterium]